MQKIVLVMKLTILLLTAVIFSAHASGIAQNVTISGKDITLKQVFSVIEKQTGYVFFSYRNFFPAKKMVTLSVYNIPLRGLLDMILKDEPLKYVIQDKTIFLSGKAESNISPLLPGNTALSIETHPVKIQVTNTDGVPLAGASVIVKNSQKSGIADVAGMLSLNVNVGDVLEISFVGFEKQTFTIKNETAFITIALKNVDAKLKEVIINKGYYEEKRELSTGSVARVDAKDIERQPVTSVLSAMQGRMAGVDIVQHSGLPGSGFYVKIRGRNNIRNDGAEPLYLVDGVPLSTSTMNNEGMFNNPTLDAGFNRIGPTTGFNAISILNPADIENIEVLKDADATSIYGSRGANGVVLITTKKGKPGKTSFFVNAQMGTRRVSKMMKMLDVEDYIMIRKEAFLNDNTSPGAADYDINGTWDQHKNTDWQKGLIGGTSYTSQVQAGISGGNRFTQFLMSGTLYNEGSVYSYTNDHKYTKGAAHIKLSHTSEDKKWKVDISGNYITDRNNLPTLDFMQYAFGLPPNNPDLYKPDGSLNFGLGFSNYIAQLRRTYFAQTNGLTTSGNISYKILNNLNVQLSLGFNDVNLMERGTIPSTIYDPNSVNADPSRSNMSISNAKNQSWNAEPLITWNNKLWKGNLSILLGSTFQGSGKSIIGNSGFGFPNNALINNLGAASTVTVLPSENVNYRYNAIFGRINYVADEKYILNLTARRDGSSRFGEGKQFGNFGAVGAAWLFAKEPFIANRFSFLSSGKLRGSYGTTGNDRIGDYLYLNTYSVSSATYQGIKGIKPSQLYNRDFSWETNTKLEFALELGAFNDRIYLTAAFYRNISSNQLVGMPLPGTTGFPSIQMNLDATIRNIGWEFELNTVNIKTKDFDWSSSFNLSIPRNKLISFPGLKGSTYNRYYVVGQPITILKMYHYTGIDPVTGLYTFKDFNGDQNITSQDDKEAIGNLSPKYLGGLNNNFSYKNFELAFLFQFTKQSGRDFRSGSPTPGARSAYPTFMLDRWQPGKTDAYVQKPSNKPEAFRANDFFQSSDGIISDASYIRLKNISLSYQLPSKLVRKSNVQLYILAQNLFTITNYKGVDPESQMNWRLPPLKVITAGLKLTL